MFKRSEPQRGFYSLGQSGHLSPPPAPLLLTGACCRFCLSGTCVFHQILWFCFKMILEFMRNFLNKKESLKKSYKKILVYNKRYQMILKDRSKKFYQVWYAARNAVAQGREPKFSKSCILAA